MYSKEYLLSELRLPKDFIGYNYETVFHFSKKYRFKINLGENNTHNIDLNNLGENLLLLNMAYIYRLEMSQYASPKVGCLISLKSDRYVRKDFTIDKNDHLTYRSFKSALNKFEALGFINIAIGYKSLSRTKRGDIKSKLVHSKGCRSIMYLTDNGSKFISQYLSATTTAVKVEEVTVKNIVIVKDSGYKHICNNYQLRSNLKLINSSIGRFSYYCIEDNDDCSNKKFNIGSHISAYGEPNITYINKYIVLYNRVFSDKYLNKGGRFFNEISSMAKKQRSTLLIDGKQTVEFDYSCLHPRMLYHQLGIEEQRDIYSIGIDATDPDFENIRTAHKIAFNVLINCSKKNPVKAMNKFYYKQSIRKFKDKTRKPMKIPTGWTTDRLIENVKNNHPMLAKYFNTGMGIKLQYLESKIAEKIMLHFANKGRPCLSVHDSFIVWKEDEEELRKIMLKNYKKVIKTEFEAVVKWFV